ncbi:MAG: hypothetical protein V2A79_04965 [Planctomycetota bacterium]
MSRCTRARVMFGAAVAVFLTGVLWVSAAAPDAVQGEYERRLAELKADDLDGHLQLARWCEVQGAWELVRQECTTILARNGEHEDAKLLLKLAMRHLGESGPNPPGEGKAERRASGETAGRLGRILSDQEVSRIRWKEMMDQEPQGLAIQFKNDVIQRFLDALEGKPGFSTREERREFMRLKPMEKVRLIREHTRQTGDQFAEDIIIKTDPKRMLDFERRVLPVVLNGCATATCHGNPEVSRFTLYTDAVLSKNKVYTNYLMMHAYRVGDKRLINRDNQPKSLLLTYGFLELPPGQQMEPTDKHPVEIQPLFRGTNDPKYQAVREWLESLSALEPDYGISLEPSGSGP